MNLFGRNNTLILLLLMTAFFAACTSKKKATEVVMFETLDNKRTGIDFSNNLSYNQQFNLFKYMYFYNGSGVGAADFNNDGLTDLFFGSNQHDNKLYLNVGGIKFKDITKEAGIPEDGGWTTGISVVDINNDGLMDMYVCRVGKYEILHSTNQLLINQGNDKNGIPTFKDQATAYGLNFSGFSTQAAFFDYDNDGDLDMFLLNHSVHENGTFRPRKDFIGTYDSLSGDRIFRNEGNIFKDVTKQTGISSTAIGYGLGVVIADINLDGYPDIYVGNDFHENDYLYINQKNGTFTEEGQERMMHTSQYSMGVDVADVNNDAFPEIISVDMLPADPYILKRSLGEDALDIFNFKIGAGYGHQYTRNNFQYNRRNQLFSEVGLYSGIAATDWSWAPLWVDFDNDGLKDLFISNGIPKRMNDIDYINFVTNGEIQQMIRDNNMQGKDLALINKFPEIKLPNKFYKNNGNLSFTDVATGIEGNQPTFSNGAVYADLDNDGDLDIVVNNIDAPVLLYENKNNKPGKKSSVTISLKGDKKNINAIGSRVIVYTKNDVRTYEKYPVKGFLSSMENPVLIGIENSVIDSMLLIWPDNSFQHVTMPVGKSSINMQYQSGLPKFNYSQLTSRIKNSTTPMVDITHAASLDYLHKENQFAEFDREPLIPHMLSTEGPALAVADINHDGLEDVFIGSSRNHLPAVFLQQNSGKFTRSQQPVLDKDSIYENTDACFADVNNDGNIDLIVASGGNEFFGDEFHNSPRVYLNDGKANFTKLENAFTNLFLTASTVVPYDFNGDGFIDLFIGGRAVPWEYGQVPQSYLLMNDKTGKFTDVTKMYAPELSLAGFVTQALWFDIDKDGDKDLLLSLEWGGIEAFVNNKGKFTKKILTDKNGWWNFILPVDIDIDGDIDLIAGNLGLNSRLKASDKEPLRLYFNDFDGNGKKEQVLTYYLEGKEIPFANKVELEKQMPVLKKKFLYAGDFAKATLQELFTSEKLDEATKLTATYLSSAVLINKGNLHFETKALPMEAQFSSMKDAVVVNANDDNLPDILIMGNYYDPNIEMGRYDADFGTILINKGKGNFLAETINGLAVKGQVRHIKPVTIGKQPAFILARNSDSAMLIKFGERMYKK
ncbi:VCBS repeat-containing protein [Ferruginibacter sp.]|uniref:VCBS repeat-containing protein n=1 Tax=Ferruginibacter sp. TaxID=1940288 RepID=UPI002657F3E7|nr:VCBS repeat-containing protein [Ferruginibacter sp.]